MQLTEQQTRLIERTINAIESGSPEGNYAALAVYADGPHNVRQITYGRAQTTEYGNLRELVRMYVAANGRLAAALANDVPRIGRTPLTDDLRFRALLRDAGRNDPAMRRIQDRFFDSRYFRPAIDWAERHGFALPLSALVIFDSFIHSGGMPSALCRRIGVRMPAAGGDERAWIDAYVRIRHDWLRHHPRAALHATIYRTHAWLEQIAKGNWDLAQMPLRVNGIDVTPG